VEFLNDLFRWYTDGTDKQLCLFFDDNIDKIVEFTFGVIVVCLSGVRAKGREKQVDPECYLVSTRREERRGTYEDQETSMQL
jgi:hypothetical protein